MTKEWMQKLSELREQIKEDWAKSRYVGDLDSETLQCNAGAIGQIRLIDRLLEAEFVEQDRE
jgi:hypothetical protein